MCYNICIMTISLIEGPEGVSYSTGEAIIPCTNLSRDALATSTAIHKLAMEKLQSSCVILDYKPGYQGQWRITAETPDGQKYEIAFWEKDIVQEIMKVKEVDISFKPSLELDTPSYHDGFSLAAAHYFKNNPIKESKLFSRFHTEPRVVLRDGKIQILKGIPKAEVPFRKTYQNESMKRREAENRATIDTYVAFLKKEIGSEKLEEIQRTYGFDFNKIRYLEPKHIYLCNIGMNNIEYRDVLRFKQKLEIEIGSNPEATIGLLGSPFTNREIRGLIRMFGGESQLKDIPDLSVGQIMHVLETPKSLWNRIYTGRKFTTQITGSYNSDVTDRKTFRPWVDQQELLQVFNTIKDPFPGQSVSPKKLDRFYFEMLTKVVVKKHLMRSETSDGSRHGNWRVGALIPSPYKDKNGDTVYYRVDKGVDSGHGKLWIVLRPASKDYDHSLPVIRVPRDTSKDLYAQRGGHTLTRDLAPNAGYHNSATTIEEDEEFFKEFTIPLWMAQFGRALKVFRNVKTSADLPALELAVKETYKELIGDLIGKVKNGRLDPEVKDKVKELLNPALKTFLEAKGRKKIEAAHNFFAILYHVAPYEEEDFNRLHDLMEGKKPRPLASIGNSLGGFDAQFDFFSHTFKDNRIPISDVFLYTHSTLKVSKQDDNMFSNYVVNNVDLLNTLGVQIHIDHITEFNDPVTLATEGTLLGQGAQMAALDAKSKGREFPVSVSLRVIKPNEKSTNPQLTDTKIHRRRFEDLVEGVDYEVLDQYAHISEYDEYARTFKIAGRTLEAWRRTGISMNLYDLSSDIVRTWRYVKGAHPHIPKVLSNQKLVVFSGEKGENYYGYIPVKHRRELERYIYRPLDLSELKELEEREEHGIISPNTNGNSHSRKRQPIFTRERLLYYLNRGVDCRSTGKKAGNSVSQAASLKSKRVSEKPRFTRRQLLAHLNHKMASELSPRVLPATS